MLMRKESRNLLILNYPERAFYSLSLHVSPCYLLLLILILLLLFIGSNPSVSKEDEKIFCGIEREDF